MDSSYTGKNGVGEEDLARMIPQQWKKCAEGNVER
jgi:hypothetical protein